MRRSEDICAPLVHLVFNVLMCVLFVWGGGTAGALVKSTSYGCECRSSCVLFKANWRVRLSSLHVKHSRARIADGPCTSVQATLPHAGAPFKQLPRTVVGRPCRKCTYIHSSSLA